MSTHDPISPTPVGVAKLVGQWVNADPNTLSTKRIEITGPGPSGLDLTSLRIRTYGSGGGGTTEIPHNPTGLNLFCESVSWKNEDVVAGLAYIDDAFAESVLTLKFISESELILEKFTIFKDNSERHHYFKAERFTKVGGDVPSQITDDVDEGEEEDEQDDIAKQLVGHPMPLSDMTDLNGNAISPDQVRGMPLLIDFFATWCGPCRMASPVLQRLHETYGPRGLVVIGASASEGDNGARSPEVRDKVAQYAQTHNLTYLVTYGNDAWSNDCGVDGYPTFFFVDRDSVVREVVIGYGEGLAKYFEQVVQRLLE